MVDDTKSELENKYDALERAAFARLRRTVLAARKAKQRRRQARLHLLRVQERKKAAQAKTSPRLVALLSREQANGQADGQIPVAAAAPPAVPIPPIVV